MGRVQDLASLVYLLPISCVDGEVPKRRGRSVSGTNKRAESIASGQEDMRYRQQDMTS